MSDNLLGIAIILIFLAIIWYSFGFIVALITYLIGLVVVKVLFPNH